MSRFAYGVGAALALSGITAAVAGIILGEFKPTAIGLVLILGAMVFAVLYRGGRWKEVPQFDESNRPSCH